MLDDKDGFLTIEELKADMELASMRGFVTDLLNKDVWFKGVDELGLHKFIKFQLMTYATDLDKALDFVVWNAR